MPETHNIYRWMRVGEVIGFCRSLYASWNDETCREMLELFRLDPRKKVKHLSKGMLVKLSLLLAVSHDPELLVLDEPMAGLDPVAREEFLDGVLRTICDRGQTVLFSTHTLDDVQRLADTVGILYDGQLLLVHARSTSSWPTRSACGRRSATAPRPSSSRPGTIWQRVEGREWLVTVGDFSPRWSPQIREQEPRRPRRSDRPGAGRRLQRPRQRTKGRTMNWLIWKEYRQNRLIVFFGVGLLFLPYLAALAAFGSRAIWYHDAPNAAEVRRVSSIVAFYSIAICQFVMAPARRKRDRRRTGGSFGGVHRLPAACREPGSSWPKSPGRGGHGGDLDSEPVGHAARHTRGFLGRDCRDLSATSSTASSQPRPWASRSTASPGCCLRFSTARRSASAAAWSRPGSSPRRSCWSSGRSWPTAAVLTWLGAIFIPICLVLAAASFTAGTWYYLRRVEP